MSFYFTSYTSQRGEAGSGSCSSGNDHRQI